jgi:hypothetical protein
VNFLNDLLLFRMGFVASFRRYAMLGASHWKANEGFYNRLTLEKDGDNFENDFASRDFAHQFPNYAEFWKRHVCPATNRPRDIMPRAGTSDIVCRIMQTSYSILIKLLDASDSLAMVQAGNLGSQNRNSRDAIEASGNALQLASDLQSTLSGKPAPKKPKPNLFGVLNVRIDLFPDFDTNWKPSRDSASEYRRYLIHEGLFYTVQNQITGETLVLDRASFLAGVAWRDANASYRANPAAWKGLETVCKEVFDETVGFIDRTYEQLVAKMNALLTNPDYQQLWGWNNHCPLGPIVGTVSFSQQNSSASARL